MENFVSRCGFRMSPACPADGTLSCVLSPRKADIRFDSAAGNLFLFAFSAGESFQFRVYFPKSTVFVAMTV